MNDPRSHPSRDAQLAKDCAAGSRVAWDEFYGKHRALIEAVVWRHTSVASPDERQDVVQNIYMRLVVALASFDPTRGASLRTFISVVAQRVCLDWLRSGKNLDHAGVNRPVDHHDCNEDRTTVVLVSDDEGPDRAMERAERALLVRSAIERLSEVCRELLQFRFYQGLTYAAIAELQGKKENTVTTSALRCLARLRTAMHDIGLREFGS